MLVQETKEHREARLERASQTDVGAEVQGSKAVMAGQSEACRCWCRRLKNREKQGWSKGVDKGRL